MMISFVFSKLSYLYISFVGFIFSYLCLALIIKGYAGQNLQSKLASKLYETLWFNKLLLFSLFLYFLILLSIYSSPIYLDEGGISLTVEGVSFKYSGDYFTELCRLFGSGAAFSTGAKIAYALISKHGIGVLPKAGISAGGGVGSVLIYNMTIDGFILVKGFLTQTASSGESKPAECTVYVEKMSLKGGLVGSSSNNDSTGSLILDTLSKKSGGAINPNIFKHSVHQKAEIAQNLSLIDNEISFKKQGEIFEGNFKFSNRQPDSKVLTELKEVTNQNLADVFGQESVADVVVQTVEPNASQLERSIFINCPLESTELYADKLLVINILNNDLLLHFIMIYFVFMLIFIYTLKLIGDKGLYTQDLQTKVQALPLGKYLDMLISKSINTWKFSNNLWLYIIMVFLFLFLCFSAFAIFACLLSLKS